MSPRTPGSTFNELELYCEDSTLIGGFNTVVTELNYLEIIHNAAVPIIAHLYGYRETTSGEKVIDTGLLIPGAGVQRRVDVDLHSAVGQGTFGTLVLTSDAPRGALTAYVAQYQIDSFIPFIFHLVARSPLAPREM